jgi:hypothetical protein
MITAEHAIARFRRDAQLSAVVRVGLGIAALFCLLAPAIIGKTFDTGFLLLVIGTLWLSLSFRAARGSQNTREFPALIAAGRYDLAEQRIERTLKTFSLFKSVKLLGLHHLAMLRHAQSRYRETAMLCRAVLGQRLGNLGSLSKQSRLMLADALLGMDDLGGAYEAIIRLYDQRLTLAEALSLLKIELDYESRIGAWPQMLHNVRTKVELSELMPAPSSARCQALLALAAMKAGRTDLAEWLRRRAELLGDAEMLKNERPVLRELWQHTDRSN